MAFWKFTGASAEFFPTLGGYVQPGQILDFGIQAPPVEQELRQDSVATKKSTISNWQTDPGPATVALQHIQLQTAGTTFGVATGKTQTTAPAAGGAAGLPATPAGYAQITVNGTPRLIPYY